jgi:hypothetical protein
MGVYDLILGLPSDWVRLAAYLEEVIKHLWTKQVT